MTRPRPYLIACLAVAALAIARASSADVHLLVISGSPGDQEHAVKFDRWVSTLLDTATRNGVPPDHIVYLADSPATGTKAAGRSTREQVERAFADLAGRATADDEVVIVLFGHGSFDGRRGAFNVPGPDLFSDDFARLLQKIPSQHVAFVDTTSASGAFLEPLAGPGRAIVTATQTGGERNETRFPDYFVEAFKDGAADRDRDGRVTIREAFEYARAKVADAYQKEGIIQTEHAALNDGTDGTFAGTLALAPSATATAASATSDPALKALLEQRQQLELKVAALRQRKGSMEAPAYQSELEQLLVQLATKTREIQQRQGKK